MTVDVLSHYLGLAAVGTVDGKLGTHEHVVTLKPFKHEQSVPEWSNWGAVKSNTHGHLGGHDLDLAVFADLETEWTLEKMFVEI